MRRKKRHRISIQSPERIAGNAYQQELLLKNEKLISKVDMLISEKWFLLAALTKAVNDLEAGRAEDTRQQLISAVAYFDTRHFGVESNLLYHKK